MEKPDFLEDEMLTYLDDLRDSGVTNMFGAASYLVDEFSLNIHAARMVLSFWMGTYSERQPKE